VPDRTGAVAITYFTDPLCSWSWAFEPVRARVTREHGDHVTWLYRMGGLLPSWTVFRDPLNAIHTPAQLAPAWCHVTAMTGVAIDEAIWREDPPSSSFPACLAVKAAAGQGREAEERCLLAARTAVMTRRLNVSRGEVLLQLATELGAEGAFDVNQFARDLQSPAVASAFAADLRECRAQQVGRFPTLIVRGPKGSRIVVGYRPYELLLQVLEAVGLSGEAGATTEPTAPESTASCAEA